MNSWKILKLLIPLMVLCNEINCAANLKDTILMTDKIVGTALYLAPIIGQYKLENEYISSTIPLRDLKDSEVNSSFILNLFENLCKKIGVKSSSVELRYSFSADPYLIAITDTFRPRIIINRCFFMLPNDQQEAILAHELIHVKYKDPLFGKIFMICALPAIYALVQHAISIIIKKIGDLIKLKTGSSKVDSITNVLSCISKSVLLQRYLDKLTGTTQKLVAKMSKSMEKRADLQSASLAGTAQGSINFLNNFLSASSDDFHPSNKERVNYLKEHLNIIHS